MKSAKRIHGLGGSSAAMLFVAMVLWGISGPVDKYIMLQNVPVMLLLAVKYAIAAILFLFLYMPRKIKFTSNFKWLVVKSALSSVQIIMITVGISKVAGINYSVLIALGPIILFTSSILILHDKLRLRVLLGLVIALIGVSLVIATEEHSGANTDDVLLGNALIIGALIVDSVVTIMSKYLTSVMNPKNIAGFTLGWNAIIYTILASAASSSIDFASITVRAWEIIAVSGVALVFVPWILYYESLKKTDVESLSVFVYISPITAALTSVVILSESFTFQLLIGAGLVLTGLGLSQHEARMLWLHSHLPAKFVSSKNLHFLSRNRK